MPKPEQAIHSTVFPSNPNPFLNRIRELVDGNFSQMESPEVQACLWVLIGQSYGQLATVDTVEEHARLAELIPPL